MLAVRPARHSDIPECHGSGSSYTAWAADLDGVPVGVIGIALTRPRACLFCAFDEVLRPHLRSLTVLRLIKRVEGEIRARGLPVYAIRERDEPKAAAMLARLGFEPVSQVDGSEIWEWRA